jgi:hypothetical protein
MVGTHCRRDAAHVPADATLWLRINDIDDGLGDNAGTLDISIEVDDFIDQVEADKAAYHAEVAKAKAGG